jgi:hypothetical protein
MSGPELAADTGQVEMWGVAVLTRGDSGLTARVPPRWFPTAVEARARMEAYVVAWVAEMPDPDEITVRWGVAGEAIIVTLTYLVIVALPYRDDFDAALTDWTRRHMSGVSAR